MSGEIEVTVRGYLAADAVVKTVHGNQVCELRVAAGVRRKDSAEVWQDIRTDWVDVSAWNRLAADCVALRKGEHVEVRGTLTPGAYISRDGEAVATSSVMARTVLTVVRAPKTDAATWNAPALTAA